MTTLDEQHNDHIWITVDGQNWAIHSRVGNEFRLWRGYQPNLEYRVVRLVDPDWERYCQAAVDMLAARWPPAPISDPPGDSW